MTKRILVVEDNPVNRRLRIAQLTSAGYEAEGVEDATGAEQAIRDRAPSLIVMDIGLPGKDGFTLTQELKSDPATNLIPILVLTSYAMLSDRVRAYAAGCDDYLTKPVNRGLLIERVQHLIDSAERRSATGSAGSAA